MRWELETWDANLKFHFDFRGPDLHARGRFFEHGRPIPPEFVPLRLVQLTKKSGYPGLFTGPSSFQMVVGARMGAVLEGVAPTRAGLDFAPVAIERPDGEPGPEGYSFFKVLDLVDAVVPERSQVKPVHFKGEFRRYSARITARFAFRDDAVAGRHVWMDKHLKSRVFVFISDEVRAAMMAAGLTGVATRPVDPRLTPHGSPVLKGPPESHRRHAALASAKRNGYTAPANARIAPLVRKAAPGARATALVRRRDAGPGKEVRP